jgi:hypothetical protein
VSVSAPTSAKALARQNVKGLWIAIPTPFSADGSRVDEDALAASGRALREEKASHGRDFVSQS